jgi:hypothetical protein
VFIWHFARLQVVKIRKGRGNLLPISFGAKKLTRGKQREKMSKEKRR